MPSKKDKKKDVSRPQRPGFVNYTQVAFDYSSLETTSRKPKKVSLKKPSLDSPSTDLLELLLNGKNTERNKKSPSGLPTELSLEDVNNKNPNFDFSRKASETNGIQQNHHFLSSCISEDLSKGIQNCSLVDTSNEIENSDASKNTGIPDYNETELGPKNSTSSVPVSKKEKKKVEKKTKKRNGAKKTLYPTHLTSEEIQHGLEHRVLHSGVLRVNPSNRKHSYITCDGFDSDIFIPTHVFSNRAIEGDLVAFKILEDHEIELISGKIPSSVKDCGMNIGKIVGIIHRNPIDIIVGTIIKTPGKSTCYFLKPADRRFPLVCILDDEPTKQFIPDPETIPNNIFSVRITKWGESGYFPLGKIQKNIGPVDDLKSSSEAIVEQYQIQSELFSKKILKKLPKPSKISPNEMPFRRDFRELLTFTIDPKSARDLDDAISIREISKDHIKVWVHIADVSFYVAPDSALDKEAYQRAVTVYLAEKNFPMLPRALSEDLISLTPFTDKLALSFSWTMDKQANILASSYCRSIINSDAKLSYEQAQNILDRIEDDSIELNPDVSMAQLKEDILELGRISSILRERRFEQGALQLESSKLSVRVEAYQPTSIYTDKRDAAHSLVEELMLLANNSAATVLEKKFPDNSILRIHPSPKKDQFVAFSKLIDCFGYNFDTSSSAAIQASLNSSDGLLKECLYHHLKRTMQKAKYICSGETSNHQHYALSTSCYTHFTSPIRRYVDIIIHRQLIAALEDREEHGISYVYLCEAAEHTTFKNNCAQKAQAQSVFLFLAHYLYNLKQSSGSDELLSLKESALVCQISSEWIELLVSKYDISQRVYFKKLPLSGHKVSSSSVTLYWTDEPIVSNSGPSSPLSEFSFSTNVTDDLILSSEILDECGPDLSNEALINVSDAHGFTQKINVLDSIEVNLTVNIKTFPPSIELQISNPVDQFT